MLPAQVGASAGAGAVYRCDWSCHTGDCWCWPLVLASERMPKRGRRGRSSKADAELLAEAEELLAEARIKAREEADRDLHRVHGGEAAWRLEKQRHRRGGSSPSPSDPRSPSPEPTHRDRTLGDGILLEQTAAKRTQPKTVCLGPRSLD